MNDGDQIRVTMTWSQLKELAAFAQEKADSFPEMATLDWILRDKLNRMKARQDYAPLTKK